MDADVGIGGDRQRTLYALLAISALALAARLVGLGARVFHWDEGRVGYWILRYAETGVWEYQPIVHGPFLYHVNKYVFALLGPSDFSARLIVALVGGLIPLAAWLFRDRLGDIELVGLGFFLAANPVLLYYSRFMRNDVLVAAFMLIALGCFVRAIDTDSAWYLYPAAGSFALGFTTKENAILYPLCWAGAVVLLLDHRLFRVPTLRSRATGTNAGVGADATTGTDSDTNTDGEPDATTDSIAGDGGTPRDMRRAIVASHARQVLGGARRWAGPLALSALLFVAIVVVFYAPRTGGEGLGLAAAFVDPTLWPALLERTLLTNTESIYDLWVGGSHQDHAYLPFLGDYLETLLYGAAVLSLLAVLGFLADRYSASGPRDLVALSFYWGIASVLGYPIVTDIQAPWATVHAIVPLAIPAAVGLALVFRWGGDALAAGDAVGIALTAVVLVLAAGTTGATAVGVAYLEPTDAGEEELLQWAQPDDDLKPTLERIAVLAERNEGTDVLFWGTEHPDSGETLFYTENETFDAEPADSGWYDRLPLPWYLERYGAAVDSTPPGTDPATTLEDAPPVVIAYEWDRDELEHYLGGYTAYRHEFKLWDEEIVIFVNESRLDRDRPTRPPSETRSPPIVRPVALSGS